MALVHNTFIRGLNTIYLQAPYIPPSDAQLVEDFFTYCQCWSALVDLHHKHEEEYLFSALEERIPSSKGIFNVNVGQHEEFHDALVEFEQYSRQGLEKKTEFSAKTMIGMIDRLAEPLMGHLKKEITTLMSLQESGQGKDVMDIHEEYEVRVRNKLDAVSLSTILLICLCIRIYQLTMHGCHCHRPRLDPSLSSTQTRLSRVVSILSQSCLGLRHILSSTSSHGSMRAHGSLDAQTTGASRQRCGCTVVTWLEHESAYESDPNHRWRI